jgi:hypothetical protein
VKQTGPAKGFDFDVSKVKQIFDLLLKEKQLKFPKGHKLPTAQEKEDRIVNGMIPLLTARVIARSSIGKSSRLLNRAD